MSKRLLKRLSSCFKRRSVRNYRESSGAGLVQVLEVRQMLTAPTLDTLYDLTLAEDAPERSVDLTGITAGAGEVQPLRVTAISGNTSLIAAPSVDYSSPNATGTLRFTPVANVHGSTSITVTVEDGGPDLDLGTAADNERFSRTFNVTVTPVNDLPTLNTLSDMTLSEEAPQQTVSLAGISAGGGENQPLRVTATSSNTALIPNPTSTYTSPQATGSIRFTPAANRFGTAVITVTVEDGGLDSKLSTASDNATFSRTFTVTVNNINDAPLFDAVSDLTISEDAPEQTVSLTGIEAGPFEVQPMRISASSSNPGLIPNPAVDYTSPNSTGAVRLQPVANLSGTAVITLLLEDGGQDEDLSTAADNLTATRTFLVTVNPVNDAPTLDPVGNLSLTEDDAEQTVNLSGIAAGGGESQPLRVTAASSNTALIPNPSVTYSSADAIGSIRFTPVADQSGTALISVTVEDGGLDGNLGTAGDNATTTRLFTVTVAAVNDAPTLDSLSDLNINEDASEQTVNLAGISAGGGETQVLRVSASSSNTGLIPNPAVTYTSANATGSIRFTPVSDQSGTALITVTVEDAGLDGDLSTSADNLTVTRTFLVTVAAVNDKPTVNTLSDLQLVRDAAEQTVSLSGITAGGGESQPLRVSAVSSNTGLIPDPATTYTSPDATGSIRFTPVAGASGSAVVTVSVEDGGLDGDLSTAGDNQLFSVTFTVVVNDPPTLDAISDVGVSEDAAEQSVGLSGIGAGPGESQALRVRASSGSPALIADPVITYTSPDATATLKFTPITDQSGAAVITVTVEDAGVDGDFSTSADNRTTSRTFTITVSAVNDAPTLNTLSDSTIAEDASEQTVNLSGITAGGGETQPLRVTASSSATGLIPNPSVTYTSADATGSIRYTPVADQSGTATITVTVEDGGLDGDLSTAGDNLTFSRSFVVTVTAVNDAPTLDSLSDLTISEDAAEQTVNLSGITAGGGETQPLRVTASSSATGLIPNPAVTYTSADATGSIRFTPVADQSGTATITVTIEDGGLDGDLGTAADNGVSSRTFVVTVSAVNDVPTLNSLSDSTIAEDASEQTVNLAGITAGGGESQPLRVTATSSNTALIPNPSVSYTSANATGSIRYTPNADQNGAATITVTVEDGGLDNDLSTAADNLTFSRTFVVTVTSVNDVPTIDQPSDLTIDEDASEQTVNLTGITAGGGESQPLRVTVSSSNTSLIPTPTLTYSSPDSTGSIKFTPIADLSGTSTITLTVEDGGPDLDLGTAGDNLVTTKTFVVTVRAVNDLPTLDTLYDLTITEDSGEATVDLSGITAGADESQTLRVTATSGDTGMIPTPSVVYTSANSTGAIKFTPAVNRHGIVTITVTVEDAGLDGDINTTADNGYFSRSFPLTITPVNDAPDFDQPGNVTVDEDAAEQTVNLTGISAGPWESQPIRVTASSSNTSLIPTPSVTYATPDSAGTLKFTPVANQSGTAVISVTVEDGGGDGKLETSADNVTVTKTFTVTVNAVNDVPTVDSLSDATISEDAAEQTVNLSGITAGGGETQPLKVTASSSNAALIPTPTVVYTSADATGSVKYTPVADQSGVAVITVTVEDGGLDGNLGTAGDNATTTVTFTVTVRAVNDAPTLNQPSNATIDEDAAEQTVNLSGITAGGGESQPLKVTSSSSNTGLIPAPTVVYTSANATGSLKYTPVADQSGVAVITVVVEDGGLDGDLSTTGDNLTVTRTFTVTVNAVNDAPTIDALYDSTISEDAAEQVVDLTGIGAGGGETQPLKVTASSSNASLIPTPTIVYTSANATGSLKYTPAADQSGSAVITVVVEDGGLDGDLSSTGDNGSTTLTFTVTVTAVNDAPTLDDLYDAAIAEDAAEQTVDLSGISAGGGENQPLKVTASSSNTALIAAPTVVYTSANATGTVKYTPVANQHGTAVITVVVEDGGLDGNLSTSGDNLTVTKTFTVTVTPVNDAPTLDQPGDVTVAEDAGEQTVSLTGISAGGGESQPLKVTASSSNTGLIPDPTVVYSSADATGSLKFTSALNLSGSAVITVVVEDGGLDGNLSTSGDNLTVTKTFTVTVTAVNDAPTVDQPSDATIDEDAAEQTVNLSGITAGGGETQPLKVTASSSNTGLIAAPTVVYTSADATGSVKYTPVADQSGVAVITVTVEDGGLDGDLGTAGDNATTTVTFTVTVRAVNDAPTLNQPSDATIDEDAAEQTVNLSGITAGGGESQPLKVTSSSSNTAVIPDPTVVYTSADATGTLKYTPVADQSGVVVITVVVEDGGLDGDLSTTGDNLTVTRTFTVTVNAVNDAPTIDALYDSTISEDAAEQVVDLTGIGAGGGETQPLKVTASSSNAALIPTPTIVYTSADAAGSLKYTPVADQSGSALITVVVEDGGLDGDLSSTGDNGTTTLTFTVTVDAVNDSPTLDDLYDATIAEDAAEQTVDLSGIFAGGGENQPLKVTATSSDTTLIAAPTVDYTSANATGTVKYTPVADQHGSAVITVVVEDGGLDGDLGTSGDNLTVTKTFTVTVTPVNDAPTLDQPGDVTVAEDAGEQTVSLTGISAGGGESQPLKVTATSSDTGLIPDPTVVYSSADATGSLKYTSALNLSGSAVITVVVEDGGLDGNLSTSGDNLTVTKTFTVTVTAVNDAPTLDQPADVTIDEDAAEQTVNLTGISAGGGESQPLKVTATSTNTALIPDPTVTYSSADATGSFAFTPVANQSGVALILVTVEDGGLDGDLGTTGDNATTTLIISVTVAAINDAPTLDQPSDATIDEDAAEQTVNLTGITAGGGETQSLRVTATSSNISLIPDPTVVYTSAEATGSLKYTPVADQSGTAVITVVVEDAGLDDDFSTTSDNLTVTQTFTITVNAVNDAPTIDFISDATIDEDSPEQTVNLSGISAGGGELQPVRITATSDSTGLIPDPTVIYTSGDAAGQLLYTPVADQHGVAVISVVVEDGGLDGDLSTTADNAKTTLTFVVTVTSVNDAPTIDVPSGVTIDEDAPEQTVNLTGITAGGGEGQALRVTASSSDTGLIPDPVVVYVSADASGSLLFTPVADLSGEVVISVTVEDAGEDGDLSTQFDNSSTTVTFTVLVNPVNDAPTLDVISDVEVDEDAAELDLLITGITAGGGESQPLKVTATSDNTGLIADPAVIYTSAEEIGLIRFAPLPDQSGVAVITVLVEDGGLDGDLSTAGDNLTVSRSFTITVHPVNDVPTLDQPVDLTIDEDAPEQTVNLTGITAGGGETQPLQITAVSDNSDLIPDPLVTYTSADSTGSLKFTPTPDQSGTANIIVTVTDGGLDQDLATEADNLSTTVVFTVVVGAVNDVPTLDPLADLTIDEDAPQQLVDLSGITAGGGETQHLRVTASSSNQTLMADPRVTYTSADSTGQLRFTPLPDQNGTTTITVTVEDAGLDNDMSTAGDNATYSYSFTVTVRPINDVPLLDQPLDLTIAEDASEQTVGLTGIAAGGGESQPLRVTATSSNTTLIPAVAVDYLTPAAVGSVRFTPIADLSGTSVITVVVEDGGDDGDLSTIADNLTVTRSFTVTVTPVNDVPTLNQPVDLTIAEDAPQQTVTLTGITAGGGESQPLRVTVSSSNTTLIATPSLTYLTPDATGSIRFTPTADLSGFSVITLSVEDGGLDGNLATTGDNLTVTKSFTVTVTPVNDVPLLDQPANITIAEDAAQQTVNLTGIAAGGGESQPLQVTATSSNTGLIPNPSVTYTSAGATGSIAFTPIADQNGSAVITVTVTDGGLDGDLATTADNLSFSRSFTVTVTPVNDAPLMDALSNLTISEDAPLQTVNLTGIAAGGGESQPLKVTVSSSNTGLIPTPGLNYVSPNAGGSITFAPVANLSGSAVITVVLEDGGGDGNLATTADNLSVTRTFTVTVTAVNDAPTLDALADVAVDEDSSQQTLNLRGISAGGGESQPLKVTASSSNTGVIPNPIVVYTSADATGLLRFTPAPDQSGAVVLTVLVEDGGLDGNLSTTADNGVFTRSFTVTVNPLNDAPTLSPLSNLTIFEDATEQTVNLSGITAGGGESQPLNVTAVSSNAGLIPTPVISYTSADSTGTLKFTPTARTTGVTTITVSVEDGGLDQNLSTTADNRTFSRSFSVTVQAIRPVIISPIGSTPSQRPTFVWTSVPGAASYKVWVKNVSTGVNPFHVATSVSTQYQMPFNLGIGKFDVYVQAVFATGAVSDWSSINRFNVVTPVAVSALALRQPVYRPTLTWAALTGASKYEIWLDNRSTGQSQVYRTFVTTTSWTPDADLQLSRYRFWARGIAVDGTPAGWSPQTDFLVVTPPQPVTPLSSTFDRQQTFTWTTVLGATSYGVYLQNTSTGAVVANVSGLSTPTWTPAGTLADGNYAWWSIAESAIAGFRSDWSVRTDFYVGGRPVVTAPIGQVATLRPTIKWAGVIGAGTYDVWLNRTFGNQIDFNVFKQFGVTGNSLQVPADLVNGAEYRVWVRAVSATGEVSPWSNPQDFSVYVAMQQDSLPQSAGSGGLQLLSVEPAVVQIPQLRSLLATEVVRSERAEVSVRRAEQDELEIERATVLAAAARQVQSAAAVESSEVGAETAVDESIQDIVEALLSGDLNLT